MSTHILQGLYRNSPAVANRKAKMTETEEFARWFVELGSELIIALKDKKISLNEYPALLKVLWGAKDAFEGLNKFLDEWKQATEEDYISLANVMLDALTVDGVPKVYIQLTVDTIIQDIKWFKATREILSK